MSASLEVILEQYLNRNIPVKTQAGNYLRKAHVKAARAELAQMQAVVDASREFLVMRPFIESINDQTAGALIRNLASKIETLDKGVKDETTTGS